MTGRENLPTRRRFLAGAAALPVLAVAAAAPIAIALGQATPAARALPPGGGMPSFDGATAWLNATPLAPADLRGKVVLVQFWTYTCINWLRAHPHVRAWEQRYRDHGLVVIGVHAPEFEFEKDIANVRHAARALGVDYPVAVDSDHAVWRAFGNQAWPAFYFVDAAGRIRHRQFGEGDYARAEAVLRQLLAEAGAGQLGPEPAAVDARGIEAPADWDNLKSPENYTGYERTENFASSGGAVADRARVYVVPARLQRNQWALAGNWTMDRQAVALNEAGGRIANRFHARDLHLVMGSASPDRPVRFRVTIDGAAPGPGHGLDIDAEGWGVVREPRLYQLLRQPGAIADRTFEITFLDAGVHVHAFTFG